jgi:hypothetical protein
MQVAGHFMINSYVGIAGRMQVCGLCTSKTALISVSQPQPSTARMGDADFMSNRIRIKGWDLPQNEHNFLDLTEYKITYII